jgi:hypothetical protein
MIREEWPKIRADIEGGHPSALGLVRAKSWNPLDLKFNHQVLATPPNLKPSVCSFVSAILTGLGTTR